MPLAFRKIERKPLWIREPEGELKAWLTAGELQADALGELATQQNKLSIYLVDEQAGITIDRIVTAFAARRQRIVKLDFITFDPALLQELKIASEKTAGDTSDAAVNASHIDLINLTASKLVQFGTALLQSGALSRKMDQAVGQLINVGLKAGHIAQKDLSPEIIAKLGDAKFQPK